MAPAQDHMVALSPAAESSEAEEGAANEDDSRQPWYLSKWARAVPGLRRLYYALEDRYAEILPSNQLVRQSGKTGTALEIGCGRGRYLERLLQQGWQAEGIEPAESPSARCREKGLSVRTGRFEDFDFVESTYDAVIAWMVVEHLHDPVAVLRHIGRILKPGGQLLFSVPNVACWETWVFRNYFYILNEPTHLNHFTPSSIKRLLELSGFRLERIYYQQNLYNVTGSLGLWLTKHRFPFLDGQRLLEFCESPSMKGRLLLAPFAKLAAALRQTGRITVIATPQRSPQTT
jgi:SAM-dependent methyltransferase